MKSRIRRTMGIVLSVTLLIGCTSNKTEIKPDTKTNNDEVKITNYKYEVRYGREHNTDIDISEKEFNNPESDSICKTINILRGKGDEIEIQLPANKLAGEVAVYSDMKMKDKMTSAKFEAGSDGYLLNFTKIEDGDYKIVLKRKDKKRVFKMIIETDNS